MKKYKKILVALGVITIVILFIYFLPKQKDTINPTIPKPKIQNLIKGDFNVNLELQEDSFEYLPELPLISIKSQEPLTLQEALDIAKKLGYSENPETVNDVFEGTTYTWNSAKGPLIVYSKSRKIEYITDATKKVINKQLSDDDLQKISVDFLISNFGFSPNDIEFNFFNYLSFIPGSPHGDRVENKKDATTYQVNFSPKVTNLNILTLSPQASPIYVWVLPDGQVVKANAIKLKEIETTNVKYKLKTFSEIKLDLKKAVIISLDNGNIDLEGIRKDEIKNVSINEIELAYLLDSPNSTFLQPVYLLKGITSDIKNESGKNAAVDLYLPALSDQ